MERNCEYQDCKNYLKKRKVEGGFICKCCSKNFCSDSCLVEHLVEMGNQKRGLLKSQAEVKSNKISKKKNTETSASIFIKEGQFLEETVEKNSYFNMSNFEKLKHESKTRVLGSGAFGEVYMIKNKIDGKIFALKQMDKQRLTSVGIKSEVVYREINIHMRLVHDHIVRLYSYHEDSKAFYMIMEYADKGTLFSIIQNSKAGLSEEDSFIYFIHVASALYFLHKNQLMHRDLKPENCLVDKKGDVKLCDFGWVVESMKNEPRKTFCGTYEYMAPEIIKEVPYSKSIDIWSLGILLYELLHSYSPFSIRNKNINMYADYTDSSVEVLKNILKHNFKVDKQISPECEDLLRKLLTPEMDKRMSITDVFNHPWVQIFEKKLLQSKRVESDQVKKTLKKCRTEIAKDDDMTILENGDINLDQDKTKNDDLFNSVLDQVQTRNKKRKESLKKFNLSIDEEKKRNKIVLKVEKVTEKTDNMNEPISPIRTQIYDESNFSMFKEMQEIDKKIDEKIDEKAGKFEILKRKADKMRAKIKKNSSKIYGDIKSGNYGDFFNLETCNNLENMKTQAQSIINHSEEFMSTYNSNSNNLPNEKKKMIDSGNCHYNNYNDEIYFNHDIRSSNIKYKKSKANANKSKCENNTTRQYTSEFNSFNNNIFSNSQNKIDYIDNVHPFLSNKTEISTQTETVEGTPEKSSFLQKILGFFGTFKCGGY